MKKVCQEKKFRIKNLNFISQKKLLLINDILILKWFMNKDIIFPEVENVGIAIVREEGELNQLVWNVYLINLKNEKLSGVFVTSRGYGMYNEREVKTSNLRHFLDEVEPRSFMKIEPILENLFGISNEFWLSFYHNELMYDKKYIFLPETINEQFFTTVPLINKKGVLII
jgi:hypothetical protein